MRPASKQKKITPVSWVRVKQAKTTNNMCSRPQAGKKRSNNQPVRPVAAASKKTKQKNQSVWPVVAASKQSNNQPVWLVRPQARKNKTKINMCGLLRLQAKNKIVASSKKQNKNHQPVWPVTAASKPVAAASKPVAAASKPVAAASKKKNNQPVSRVVNLRKQGKTIFKRAGKKLFTCPRGDKQKETKQHSTCAACRHCKQDKTPHARQNDGGLSRRKNNQPINL